MDFCLSEDELAQLKGGVLGNNVNVLGYKCKNNDNDGTNFNALDCICEDGAAITGGIKNYIVLPTGGCK